MSSDIENEVLTEFKHIAMPLMELGLYDSTREFIRDAPSLGATRNLRFGFF
ncbi:MAG: hypothetical protein KJ714_05000 [Euryarchaeota archaeon]|nr:hypothetical protein [Euryarchaeota archaeon]